MKIMFNAGHGASTAGKRSPDGTVREWNINDKIVDELMILAPKYQNVTVQRADDPTGKRDVPLAERVNKANKWPADIYVSVHNNAFGTGWNSADGIETYAYSPGSTKATILAKAVQSHMVNQLKADDRGVKFANFQELRTTHMPAILVECGFMTNQAEAALMKTSAWQKRAARAIMDGIVQTYGLKLKVVPKPAPKPTPTPPPPIVSPTKSGSAVHRVIVDGKQIGAYQNDASVGNEVQKALANNPRTITIELVK